MHYRVVIYIQGVILKVLAGLMLLPVVTGLIYHEHQGLSFLVVGAASYLIGWLLTLKKPKNFMFFAKEGIVSVALAWVIISLVGALPFTMNGDIPFYPNALFETISGFTTTGASILTDVEALSHASLIWRSFTHWVGGMGVIVFMLAIVPMTGGGNAQLMRAESPGPSFGKLVPKLKQSASILYMIYFGLTILQIVLLLIAGMPLFHALCMTFGSAGTGGFGVLNDSAASYTTLQQAIITIFMILFGVNFNAYYYLLHKQPGDAFRMEEVRWYFIIIAASIAVITIDVRNMFPSLYQAFHHAAFQVGSIITTTGYSTVNFDEWPELSRAILVLLMFIGACAGSTGGGLKVSRVVILAKSVYHQIVHYIHPKAATTMKMDSRPADDETVKGVNVYLATYFFIFTASFMILTFDNRFDLETDFTAVAATLNNIGPGLGAVGPACNYNSLSLVSKFVLMFDMLAGRLELYPMLILFLPSIWRRRS